MSDPRKGVIAETDETIANLARTGALADTLKEIVDEEKVVKSGVVKLTDKVIKVPTKTGEEREFTIDYLEKLLKQILSDPDIVDNLDDETVVAIGIYENQYNRILDAAKQYVVMSLTNMRRKYIEKLMMTAIIAFVYRQADEWGVPDGVYVQSVEKMADKEQLVSGKILTEQDEKKEIEEIKKKAPNMPEFETTRNRQKRAIVHEFLNSIFEYNPDKHVASAYAPNEKDPERSKIDPKSAKDRLKKRLMNKKEPPTVQEVTTAKIPPVDTFHRMRYYYEHNFEELRKVVQDLYAEKPDLEEAVAVYGTFDTREKAQEFIQKYSKSFVSSVMTVEMNRWAFTGPFKTNRERLDFYSQETEVLKQIFEQNEKDARIGAELMKNRVRRKKKENIEQAGPDAKELTAYKKSLGPGIATQGAIDLTTATQEQLDEYYNVKKLDDELPDNAVQVDVFTTKHGEGGVLEKTEIFTKADD